MKNCECRYTRKRLLELAERLPGDAVVPLLVTEVRTGPDLDCRIVAAGALHRRGLRAGVDALIDVWTTPGAVDPYAYDWELKGLVSFLGRSGRRDALDAISRVWLEKGPLARALALHGLADCVEGVAWGAKAAGRTGAGSGGATGRPDLVDDPLVDALIALLDDSTEFQATWRHVRSGSKRPRICDVAASYIAALHPEMFPFNVHGDLLAREREILSMVNVWRTRRGLASIETLPSQGKGPAPVVAALLAAVASPISPGSRVNALTDLEAYGYEALPEIRRELERWKDDDGLARQALEGLEIRMTTPVRKVHTSAGPLAGAAPVGSEWETIGRPLTLRWLVGLVERLYRDRPPWGAGVEAVAEKRAEERGVLVEARFLVVSEVGGESTEASLEWEVSNGGEACRARRFAAVPGSLPADALRQMEGDFAAVLATAPRRGFSVRIRAVGPP
ncbi:MAG: hypothetical protein HYZ53_18185 [Planctomycetes bacterium]|nr:hypothetical protein [Planctomycetota bacterium]